jgi:hypothetical protein
VYLTNAVRVEKSFLKSGVLTDAALARRLLVEGLAQQAQDTRLPELRVQVRCIPWNFKGPI